MEKDLAYTLAVDEMPEFKALKAITECSKGMQEVAALQEQKELLFSDFINAIPQAIENSIMNTAGKALGLGDTDGTA